MITANKKLKGIYIIVLTIILFSWNTMQAKIRTDFSIPKVDLTKSTDKDSLTQGSSKQIILATYKTSLKIVQFRRDEEGNIYAYALLPKEEKLLIKINNDEDPENLSDDEKYYFFIYNLIFSKQEVLLTLGKIKGKEYEIFLDKALQEKASVTGISEKYIKVYLASDKNIPVKSFSTFKDLYYSKYAQLLFK